MQKILPHVMDNVYTTGANRQFSYKNDVSCTYAALLLFHEIISHLNSYESAISEGLSNFLNLTLVWTRGLLFSWNSQSLAMQGYEVQRDAYIFWICPFLWLLHQNVKKTYINSYGRMYNGRGCSNISTKQV